MNKLVDLEFEIRISSFFKLHYNNKLKLKFFIHVFLDELDNLYKLSVRFERFTWHSIENLLRNKKDHKILRYNP